MKVIIEFHVDNAAFEDNWETEVTKMVSSSQRHLLRHGKPVEGKKFEIIGRLHDTNGNGVGHVRYEDKDEA